MRPQILNREVSRGTLTRDNLPNGYFPLNTNANEDIAELDKQRFTSLPRPSKSLDDIIAALPSKPVSTPRTHTLTCSFSQIQRSIESESPLTIYQITSSSSSGDTSDLGWVRQGDPRSDLLLAISQQSIALPVLLNGLTGDRKLADLLTSPSPAMVAAISPLARVRAGQYAVPTFIVHGTEDEVAPFAGAERFAKEMHKQAPSVRCELLALPGARHLFDLGLEEGSRQWERLVAPGYIFLCEVLKAF